MSMPRVDGLLETIDELSLVEFNVLRGIIEAVGEMVDRLPKGVDDTKSFNALLEEHHIE